MKSAALVPFVLLFASATLTAQTASPQPPQVTVLHPPPIAIGCPVSLHVQHLAGGDVLKVDKNRPKGIAQFLHLTLINPDSRQIAAAKVRAHGLSGKIHVTQTQVDQVTPDVTRAFHLKFSSAEGNQVSSDLWVPGMTAVLSIDLDSVTFTDGSTRTFSPRDNCHIAPDPLMLIDSQ